MNSDTTSHAESTSDQLDCQAASELLSAYALDILDATERAPLAQHLANCPDCQNQLAREETVVALLGAAVPAAAPPPALRARLLDEINDTSRLTPVPAPSLAPIPLPRRPHGIFVSRMAAAGLALVASLLVIGLVTAGVLLYQARDARDTARSGQAQLAEYLRQGGTVVTLSAAETSGVSGSGKFIIAPSDQEGMLVVGNLKPSGTDQVYKVWMARGNERWMIGELTVGADGTGWKDVQCPHPVTWYDTVGVTRVGSNGATQNVLTAAIPQTQPGT